jgi:CBS domain-containing protein
MPETNFTITQGTMTITEYGNSVPYSGKLDDMSEHPVKEIINKVLKNNHHTSFPVVDSGRLHGVLLLEELKLVPREEWPELEARHVMRPVDASMFLSSDATIPQARRFLESGKLDRAAVLDGNGWIVGYVSPEDLGSGEAEGRPSDRGTP